MSLPKFRTNFRKRDFRALSNWGFDKLEIQKYWNLSTGKNVRIAILDSGIPDHQDLIINRALSRNFVKGESGLDHFDHATAVVGILNAQLSFQNAEGICPDAEIICLKVLDHDGGGEESEIYEALEYCLEIRPDIVNLSFGTQEKLNRNFEGILLRLKQAGIIVACASGNSNLSKLDYPASSDHTIAIGAIDQTNTRTTFSSYGSGIDFVFPGINLYTTCGTNRYCYVTGTSFAVPIFVGILALYLGYLKNKFFSHTSEEIIEEMKKCAVDLGAIGLDELYGHGSIDLNCLFNSIHLEYQRKPWYQRFWNFLKSSHR